MFFENFFELNINTKIDYSCVFGIDSKIDNGVFDINNNIQIYYNTSFSNSVDLAVDVGPAVDRNATGDAASSDVVLSGNADCCSK